MFRFSTGLLFGSALGNDVEHSDFTRQKFKESAARYAESGGAKIYEGDADLVWTNNPKQWHQQLARIVDHRFSTFEAFEAFAKDAKKAGVSALMLVQIQKTEKCPGGWYNGLQLCDHINGTYPAADGDLARWQKVVEDVKPMRLMWWTNMDYWSTQGQVWEEAKADRNSDVGKWFSWGAKKKDECYGTNPDGAQGSWGSDGASQGIPSALASYCSETYADYLVDSMANSWTANLHIDGYTLDCANHYQKGSCGSQGMLQCPNGDGYAGWAKIWDRVSQAQPHVVQSGESYGSWEDLIAGHADIGGQGFGDYHTAMRDFVKHGKVDAVEGVASTSGADAASVVCYLHPNYDGKQPGACPTMYFRDQTAVLKDIKLHRMWVGLEAGAGIVPQHDFDPNSYCTDGFNGCYGDSNPGAWWNVTSDPFEDGESPLWAFSKYRALNRLALRTNLHVSVSRSTVSAPAPPPSIDGYLTFEGYNSYSGHGGTDIDSKPVRHLTPEQCAQRCTDDQTCHCVTYCAKDSGDCSQGQCWKRADCDPDGFEHDSSSDPYTVFMKEHMPAPPDAGAIAYLKHDSMGPQGDAAVMVFNPGEASNVTIDLSMLPESLFGVVPYDLLTYDGTVQSGVPPLAKSWTVQMEAKSMKFFSGFSLGVFAPRQGKKTNCQADDGYRKTAKATTLQGCFLECQKDSQCENVFVEYIDMNWMESPPDAQCTLLGKIQNPGSVCSEGTGTLIKKLPGARACAHDWQSVGEILPPAQGAPVMSSESSVLCENSVIV